MTKNYLLALGLTAIVTVNANAQTIRYVKTDGSGSGVSWSEASGDLQMMINASDVGDKVYVAEGTYIPEYFPGDTVFQWLTNNFISEATDKDKAFYLKEGVEIYGGFSAIDPVSDIDQRNLELHITILSSDIGGNDGGVMDFENNMESYDDNYYHAVIAAGLDITAVLDGFHIQGGTYGASYNYIKVNETMIRQGFGAAFNVVNAKIDFRNITINKAASHGYVRNSTANFYNLSVTESLGRFEIKNSKVTIENLEYVDNRAHFYVHVDDGFPETNPSETNLHITNANFIRNTGGPAVLRISRSLEHEVNVTINRAYFTENTGQYGVMQIHSGNVNVFNSVASGNVFSNQSGFMIINSPITGTTTTVHIVNSTIVSNMDTYDWWAGSGGISGGGGPNVHVIIRNSIMWGNKMGENYINFPVQSDHQNSSIANSIIQNAVDEEGNWALSFNDLGGNSYEMPLFAEFVEALGEPFSNGDFSLQEGSPGINAGASIFYNEFIGNPAQALDLVGNHRVMGDAIDIGAFEFLDFISAVKTPSNQSIILFPNPTSDAVWITDLDGPATFEMYNMTGQLVHRGMLDRNEQTISLMALISGTYILKLTTQKGSSFSKIIKE